MVVSLVSGDWVLELWSSENSKTGVLNIHCVLWVTRPPWLEWPFQFVDEEYPCEMILSFRLIPQ